MAKDGGDTGGSDNNLSSYMKIGNIGLFFVTPNQDYIARFIYVIKFTGIENGPVADLKTF